MLLPGLWYFPLLIAMVAAYWGLPHRPEARLAYLLAISLAVLAYLLWKYLDNRIGAALLVAMAAGSLASYAIGWRLAQRRSKAWLTSGLLLPFAIFLLLRAGSPPDPPGVPLLIPVSIGFFVLRQAHFVYECYRGGIKPAGALAFLAYVFFFPSIIAGPLERFPRLM